MAENENQSGQVNSEYTGSGIDFSGVNALANTDYQRESGFVSFRNEFFEGLAKLGLFLFGVILDVLKTLWAILMGITFGVVRGIIGIGRFFRANHRRFMELDGWGKGSFFLQGLGQIKYGQVGQGIVFMATEILFVAFMAASGVSSIIKMVLLYNEGGRDSHTRLVLGIMAIIIAVAYVVVWQFGVRATHDAYQILHNFNFRNARENQLNVLLNYGKYEDGGKDLTKLSRGKIRKIMREKYGYSALSARYISYVDFKRVPERGLNVFQKIRYGVSRAFFAGYDKWRRKVKAGKWSNVFANYLEWELQKPKANNGFNYVRNKIETELLVFHHTYDKYNDYHAVLRDSEALLRVLHDPNEVLRCVYAEDPVSVKNNIAPIRRGTYVKAKEILPRIVGYFEVSFDVGRTASKLIAKALKGGENNAIAAIEQTRDKEQQAHDLFVYTNNERARAEAAGVRKAYGDYDYLHDAALQDKKSFLQRVLNEYSISEYYGGLVYDDYKLAEKLNPGNAEGARADLALRGENFEPVAELIDTYDYHGQPTTFKKQVKQYADEKFAVSILALPVIGALLTCVLPLIFSIAIGFTNWDSAHTNYEFSWDMGAWGQVFGLGAQGSDFAQTFGTLLLWTLIWSFFATFTNYIFGIVLALLINKKGIKGKSFWRTCFVITIAIPQFITLLVMSLIFADTGPINAMLTSMGFNKLPFLGMIVEGDAAFDVASADYLFPKVVIILINMWVGIPYTMLSTSGILMNIPEDLYESASIDGATPWTQFWKITMPYILFVTGPSLLTTFIGNINNFNVIYFLTGGGPSQADALGTFGAGHTDLLITWLYKLTASRAQPEYAMGSVIGILMFLVCAFFSLIMYKRMGSVQNEEEFQ